MPKARCVPFARAAPGEAREAAKKSQPQAVLAGTRDGDRTRMPSFEKRRILSPLCLPVSPPGPRWIIDAARMQDINKKASHSGEA